MDPLSLISAEVRTAFWSLTTISLTLAAPCLIKRRASPFDWLKPASVKAAATSIPSSRDARDTSAVGSASSELPAPKTAWAARSASCPPASCPTRRTTAACSRWPAPRASTPPCACCGVCSLFAAYPHKPNVGRARETRPHSSNYGQSGQSVGGVVVGGERVKHGDRAVLPRAHRGAAGARARAHAESAAARGAAQRRQ